jgi:hypothetical protein
VAESEQAFEEAREAWREALRSHVLAPPDAGFSARLKALATAAKQRAAACESVYADGFEWPPARGGARPPWELQPGSGRRGSAALWERFDEAVAELDRVSEGRSVRAVGRAYAELGEVTELLAEAVEREDRASGLLPAGGRRRRKAARG